MWRAPSGSGARRAGERRESDAGEPGDSCAEREDQSVASGSRRSSKARVETSRERSQEFRLSSASQLRHSNPIPPHRSQTLKPRRSSIHKTLNSLPPTSDPNFPNTIATDRLPVPEPV